MGRPGPEKGAAAASGGLDSGVYGLVLRLEGQVRLTVGRHGTHLFQPGFYCYVGSARRNLDRRLARHRSKEKRFHWHIDYLLEAAELVEAMAAATTRPLECELSRRVAALAAGPAVAGFGSSDCACPTHLYYFREDPRPLLGPVLERLAAGPGRVKGPSRPG